MKRIIVFGSGNGSNFEAIAKSIIRENLPIKILFVFSENPSAFILKRAEKLGIPTKVIDFKKFKKREDFDKEVLEMLQKNEPWDLLVLAGYMKILPPEIVRKYKGKIINIHPALLPSFRGLNAIEKAWKHKVKITGVSIHFVDEGVDTGPIITQIPVRIKENDTLESLEERIHKVEHLIYIEVIKKLLKIL